MRSAKQVMVRGSRVCLGVVSVEERWQGDFTGFFLMWELKFFQT